MYDYSMHIQISLIHKLSSNEVYYLTSADKWCEQVSDGSGSSGVWGCGSSSVIPPTRLTPVTGDPVLTDWILRLKLPQQVLDKVRTLHSPTKYSIRYVRYTALVIGLVEKDTNKL